MTAIALSGPTAAPVEGSLPVQGGADIQVNGQPSSEVDFAALLLGALTAPAPRVQTRDASDATPQTVEESGPEAADEPVDPADEAAAQMVAMVPVTVVPVPSTPAQAPASEARPAVTGPDVPPVGSPSVQPGEATGALAWDAPTTSGLLPADRTPHDEASVLPTNGAPAQEAAARPGDTAAPPALSAPAEPEPANQAEPSARPGQAESAREAPQAASARATVEVDARTTRAARPSADTRPEQEAATDRAVSARPQTEDTPRVAATTKPRASGESQEQPQQQHQSVKQLHPMDRIDAAKHPEATAAARPAVHHEGANLPQVEREVPKPAVDDIADAQSRPMPVTVADRAASTSVTELVRQAPAAETPQVDLSRRVIDQVVRQVTLHRLPERSDLVVRLNPPELGTLRLHIVQDAQGVASQIQATSEQTRGLLQAHLPMLQEALSNAGVRMDSVTVTSDAPFSSLAQNAPQDGAYQQQDAHQQRSGYGREPGGFTAGMPSAATVSTARTDSAGYSWLA